MLMKLYYDRKSKDPTYFVQHGIRNGKKTTTKNIYRIGKHSELLKDHPDPLAYAKEVVASYNEQIHSENVDMTLTIDFAEKITNYDNSIASKSTIQNIGYLVPGQIHSLLHLREFFDALKKKTKITFDPYKISLLLSISRIIDPKSKLSTLASLNNFFGLSNEPIEYQHILRFMDLLSANYDEYLTTLYNGSNDILKRDNSVCYFDCTNFYFEKETEDDDYVDEITGELISGLIKYGVSKEHRPNPIVQMGLFMDRDGIPLTMCINPGNQNESLCAVQTEEKMLKMFKNKEIIYCSDGGLGYTNTRKFNDFGGRKFIVTQSIKKLSNEIKSEIFADQAYKLLSDDSPIQLNTLRTLDLKSAKDTPEMFHLYNDRAYKIIETSKLVDLGLYEYKEYANGTKRKVKSKGAIKQSIIVTYSRKMAEYQKNIRNRQIERAIALLNSGKDLDELKNNQNDSRRFIKKENSNEKSVYIINEERIAEESKYDGFYAVATNFINPDVREVMDIMERRYLIEDCFRIMKTNFNGRPIYHYTRKRIIAHFMICYTSLLIYRILETLLNRKGEHYTTLEIINTIKNMNVDNFDDMFYKATYSGSKVLDSFNALFGQDINKKRYLPKQLNKIYKNILK